MKINIKKKIPNLKFRKNLIRFPNITQKEPSKLSLSLNSIDNIPNKSVAYRSILNSYKTEWDGIFKLKVISLQSKERNKNVYSRLIIVMHFKFFWSVKK